MLNIAKDEYVEYMVMSCSACILRRLCVEIYVVTFCRFHYCRRVEEEVDIPQYNFNEVSNFKPSAELMWTGYHCYLALSRETDASNSNEINCLFSKSIFTLNSFAERQKR